MMTNKKNTIFYSSLFLLLSACSAPPNSSNRIQINPNLTTQSKADYLDGGTRQVSLPLNYNQKNYKRLVLAANFFANKGYQSYGNTPIETLSTMLETELSKLKRFTLVSRHLGQKGKLAEQKFQDTRVTNTRDTMHLGKELNANYALSGGISAVKEEYDRGSKNQLIYIIRVDYQITNLETDEIIEADMAEGRAVRSIFRLPSGKIIGGFSQKDESEATKQAGIDLPIAVAEASPGAHKTSGKIIVWNNDQDEYIQDTIRQIKENPRFARQHDIYAVSLGMPTPPEWDNNYNN